MSGWDRPEHVGVGGTSDVRNSSSSIIIRQRGGDLHHPVSRPARGTNGDDGIYKGVGSPSPPPSSYPAGGAPSFPPEGSRRPAPPAQGEDPSFDAKVAAEFFRRKDAKTSLRDNGPSATTTGGGGAQAAPPPEAFESDVERAMRELEVEVGLAKSTNGRLRYSSPTPQPPQPPPPPPPPAVSAQPDLSGGRAGGDEGSSLLAQMDMRRVSPGGGKGRPGGLRDMWGTGGGSEGHSNLHGAEQQQRWGGGLSAQQAQRQGPGLKGMWGGEQPEESARPKRQGPGLRGLWSGPDMAAADAARSESQAAYMSALNRDVQEKRAFSDDTQGQQQRQQARARQDERQQYSPYSAGGRNNAVSEPGTSLAGIGTPRGGIKMMKPRQQRREFFEGADGVDSVERAADRAKKAAYAEELRKQMAEKEARMAMDERAPTSGRRRASTGGRKDNGRGSASGDGYSRAPSTPASHGRESYPGQSVPDSDGGGSPFTPVDRANDRWPSAAWSTPPPGSSCSSAGEGRLTAARRRLVEDVYGAGGMGAALGGAGYRRASTDSHGARSIGAGSHTGDTRPGQVGGGGGGESTAFDGRDWEASQGGSSSYLRTGAGVQNLRESEHAESKLQKRVAALEHQRALEAQIAAKARAKKEEEEARKREQEEETRQQQEQQRRLEADAEEGRRRKQAEQQEQLEGLYRQQEAALRKKRGGGGGRHSNDGEVDKNPRAPAYGGSPSALDGSREAATPAGFPSNGDIDVDGDLRQRQMRHRQRRATDLAPPRDRIGLGSVSGIDLETPRRRSNVPDVDDLPAGAQARAQVLRSSPPDRSGGGGGGGPGAMPTPRAGSASSARRGKASPAASAARDRFKGGSGLEGTNSPMADGVRGRTRTAGVALDGSAGGTSPGPPLQTRSLLVPVSSAALFPPFPADNTAAAAAAGDDAEAVLPFLREDDRSRPMQQSFASSEGRGANLHDPAVTASPGGFSCARGASEPPPQDEMDAFVTKWQDKHLRRRGFQGQRHQHHGVAMPPGSNERHPSSSPAGRTICRSPSRSLLGVSRALGGYASGGRGHGSAVPGGRTGELGELEESLAATSRMVDPPSLPRPPPSISHAGENVGAGGGGQAQGRLGGGGGGGGGVDREGEGEANLSEQSLTSDSILFYLSGQQRESMQDAAATPSSSMPAAGRSSATNGALSKSRSSRISASPLGLPRESSDVDGGGDYGYGWENIGDSRVMGDLQGVNASSGRLARSVQSGEEDGDQGQMSPLTRLLAETPVRLKAGDHPIRGADPTAAAPSFGSDPRMHRLATGGNDCGAQSRRTHPAAGAGAEESSPGASGSVAGAARRARALWGTPSAAAAGGGGGVAIAEALTRRGMPWEELSASGAPSR
eukprot:g9279.t1